jgi:hypothetical protein
MKHTPKPIMLYLFGFISILLVHVAPIKMALDSDDGIYGGTTNRT